MTSMVDYEAVIEEMIRASGNWSLEILRRNGVDASAYHEYQTTIVPNRFRTLADAKTRPLFGESC